MFKIFNRICVFCLKIRVNKVKDNEVKSHRKEDNDEDSVIYLDEDIFIESIKWHINSAVDKRLYNKNENISYVEFWNNSTPLCIMPTLGVNHDKLNDLYSVDKLNNPWRFFGCKEYDTLKVSNTIKNELNKYNSCDFNIELGKYEGVRVGYLYLN